MLAAIDLIRAIKIVESHINIIADANLVQPVPGGVELLVQPLVLAHQLHHLTLPARLPSLMFLKLRPNLGLAVVLLEQEVLLVPELELGPLEFLGQVVVVVVGADELLLHDRDVVLQLGEVLAQDSQLVHQPALVLLGVLELHFEGIERQGLLGLDVKQGADLGLHLGPLQLVLLQQHL